MATEPLHFSKAPIIEAVISIQITELPASTLSDLRKISAEFRSEYPHQGDLRVTQFTSGFSDEGAQAATQHRTLGTQLQSSDTKQICQMRLNGFSFHKLAPYDRWQSFRTEAGRLWMAFRVAAGPARIEKFSVRYINRLELPARARLEEFVRVYPEVPPELPQNLNNYLLRLELPLDGPGILTIHQTLLPSDRPEIAYILLDNDLSYPALGLSDEAVWQRIDAAQEVKNRVFLACITEQMKGKIY